MKNPFRYFDSTGENPTFDSRSYQPCPQWTLRFSLSSTGYPGFWTAAGFPKLVSETLEKGHSPVGANSQREERTHVYGVRRERFIAGR
jgi:hypothetical protein